MSEIHLTLKEQEEELVKQTFRPVQVLRSLLLTLLLKVYFLLPFRDGAGSL